MTNIESNTDEQKPDDVQILYSQSNDNEASNPHVNPPVNYSGVNGRNQSTERRDQKKILHKDGYSGR